jgi:hypothetical protein
MKEFLDQSSVVSETPGYGNGARNNIKLKVHPYK